MIILLTDIILILYQRVCLLGICNEESQYDTVQH